MKDFFDDFDPFERMMRNFFDDEEFFGPRRSYRIKQSNFESPFSDMWETSKEIVIIFDLPAIEKSKIDVRIDKEILILKAEQDKNNGYFTKIHLPAEVFANKIDSRFKNGVLEVIIPKKNVSKSEK